MKVCFAVQRDEGLESTVYGHFGSAPAFIVVDTEEQTASGIVNRDRNHAHGACNPMAAIGGQKVDAVVVGGIGAGALMRLNSEGIRVFRAAGPSVKFNLSLINENRLPELTMQQTCAGHQGGCGH
jgi:predicted Fe-Mo cluster-binding NifX family protein